MDDGTQPPAALAGEDGYLRRAGTVWQSHTPQLARRPSPVYLTAAAARRLALRDLIVALREGYDVDALERVMAWTGASSTEHVTLDERQAREIGEIARGLTNHHAEHLEGEEAWGVAGVLRALETGHSTPGATPVEGPDAGTTRPEITADAGIGLEDEADTEERLDDLLVDVVSVVALLLVEDGLVTVSDESDEDEAVQVAERILGSPSAPGMRRQLLDVLISRGGLLRAVQTGELPRVSP
ncbi:hypothetical protein ACFRFJ_29940 [Streptomyces hydrogenans]|uniref:hypothetical protein n=1 Tax=Streptomyces hydrogenans TaxID=1873719 RepID=UPI00367880F0